MLYLIKCFFVTSENIAKEIILSSRTYAFLYTVVLIAFKYVDVAYINVRAIYIYVVNYKARITL